MRPVWALAATALLAVGATAACGEKPEPEIAEAPPAVERAEALPELPAGWKELKNRAQGFALGLPPGWRQGARCLRSSREEGTASVLCSPDRLLTLSIAADRTDEALELDPSTFARRALAGLAGSYRRFEEREPRPFRAHYPGAIASATGVARRSGVEQELSLVVLRRDGVANFTAAIAANAKRATPAHTALAERALRTLRSGPVG